MILSTSFNIMNAYTLTTLLKVRQRNKEMAELSLFHANKQLEDEQKKLCHIKDQLTQKKLDRASMQDYFFYKAQSIPSNKREVNTLAFSAQKNICDEQALKTSLSKQMEQVKMAQSRKDRAFSYALEAHRALKAINKHHDLWQLREKKSEDLKEEYEVDDQNGVRFWLKKRG